MEINDNTDTQLLPQVNFFFGMFIFVENFSITNAIPFLILQTITLGIIIQSLKVCIVFLSPKKDTKRDLGETMLFFSCSLLSTLILTCIKYNPSNNIFYILMIIGASATSLSILGSFCREITPRRKDESLYLVIKFGFTLLLGLLVSDIFLNFDEIQELFNKPPTTTNAITFTGVLLPLLVAYDTIVSALATFKINKYPTEPSVENNLFCKVPTIFALFLTAYVLHTFNSAAVSIASIVIILIANILARTVVPPLVIKINQK